MLNSNIVAFSEIIQQENSSQLLIDYLNRNKKKKSFLFLLGDLEVLCICSDGILDEIPEGESITLTNPMYPNKPTCAFAYSCTWIIQGTDYNVAYRIDFIHFEGPDWLVLELETPPPKLPSVINSDKTPKSITIQSRTNEYLIQLREQTVTPKRSKSHVFVANITSLPTEQIG